MACATLVVSSSYNRCPLTFRRFSQPISPLICIFPEIFEHSPFMCLQPTTSVYSLRPREIKSFSFLISMFFESVGLFHFSSSTTARTEGLLHLSHGPLAPLPLGTEKEMLSPSVHSCWRVSCCNYTVLCENAL